MSNNQQLEKSWRNRRYISALDDGERHLGHVVFTETWHAYDVTKPGETGMGMKYLGEFPDREAAIHAVEVSVAMAARPKVFHAG